MMSRNSIRLSKEQNQIERKYTVNNKSKKEKYELLLNANCL